VRNPLAGIGGFAALLKRDMGPDEPMQKIADKIIRGVDSLNRTVNALLDYTRSEQVRKEEMTYGDFLIATVRQFQHEHDDLAREMRFSVAAIDGMPFKPIRLGLDPHLCRQLFFNLFTNSVEACEGTGDVIVRYGLLERGEALSKYGDGILLGSDEQAVETIITDSGSGIPDEAMESMFSPFFTTKPGGTGLGLAVVWKIVKAHAGHVLVQKESGSGAKFVVLFPVKIDATGTDARSNT
jgi:signal transduction histidine kinase